MRGSYGEGATELLSSARQYSYSGPRLGVVPQKGHANLPGGISLSPFPIPPDFPSPHLHSPFAILIHNV